MPFSYDFAKRPIEEQKRIVLSLINRGYSKQDIYEIIHQQNGALNIWVGPREISDVIKALKAEEGVKIKEERKECDDEDVRLAKRLLVKFGGDEYKTFDELTDGEFHSRIARIAVRKAKEILADEVKQGSCDDEDIELAKIIIDEHAGDEEAAKKRMIKEGMDPVVAQQAVNASKRLRSIEK